MQDPFLIFFLYTACETIVTVELIADCFRLKGRSDLKYIYNQLAFHWQAFFGGE